MRYTAAFSIAALLASLCMPAAAEDEGMYWRAQCVDGRITRVEIHALEAGHYLLDFSKLCLPAAKPQAKPDQPPAADAPPPVKERPTAAPRTT